MLRVTLLQSDNRLDLDYLGLTRQINRRWCEYLNSTQTDINYTCVFKEMVPEYYPNMHPATGKINLVNEFLNTNTDTDILIFLDSDAWIQEPTYLHNLLLRVSSNPNIHGCFSRDPYITKNTYINSGSFLIKVDDYNRQLYRDLLQMMKDDPSRLHRCESEEYHPYIFDQYYISIKIYEKRADYWIFQPPILNTPDGSIYRHSWYKTHKLYRDTYDVLDILNNNCYKIPEPFDYDAVLDKNEYPNTDPNGFDYRY